MRLGPPKPTRSPSLSSFSDPTFLLLTYLSRKLTESLFTQKSADDHKLNTVSKQVEVMRTFH